MNTDEIKIQERKECFERRTQATKCDCGGYAERVKCTVEELEKYNCGRPRECCARAFVCVLCGTRIVGQAEAPEMRY